MLRQETDTPQVNEGMAVYGLDIDALRRQSIDDIMRIDSPQVLERVRKYVHRLVAPARRHSGISPSNDPWFDNPRNVAMLDERIEASKHDPGREVSLDEIREMLGL